jgi:hypothetical protein
MGLAPFPLLLAEQVDGGLQRHDRGIGRKLDFGHLES